MDSQKNIKACKKCNNKRKIHAKGLCKSCYNYKVLNKKKHKDNLRKWKERNPEYFKDYYLIKRQMKVIKNER